MIFFSRRILAELLCQKITVYTSGSAFHKSTYEQIEKIEKEKDPP